MRGGRQIPKHSLIDDVNLSEEDDKGPPVRFANQEIRRMLTLADTRTRDVFCDLGCGWGQNLIIALTEFQVAKVVGIEEDAGRVRRCTDRLKRWEKHDQSLRGRWKVIEDDFDNLLNSEKAKAEIWGATIVFYGLTTYEGLVGEIGRNLESGGRLVYYFNGLFPEILPDNVDFPFYASRYPFRKPKSEEEWLRAVAGKKFSTLNHGELPSPAELWEELTHDADVYGDWRDASDWRRRLRKSLKTTDSH